MIDQAQLAESLGRLDAGTRALLDLSLRRAIPDDQVAKVLGVDAMSIPPRRARGIAQLADMMDIPGPAELAALLIAIPDLPEEAWGVPAPAPFAGNVSRARRAKAFRRVAVAASPLVAVGAVMAAVLVSSSSDHTNGGSGAAGTRHNAGAASAGVGQAASAAAPDARHGLPSGVQLTLAHPRAAHAVRHTSVRHHRAHHVPGAAEPAILARQPSEAAPQTQNVVLVRPSPIAHTKPRHVTHHHHAPAKPQQPTPSPSPAPVQTPSQPVSSPAPSTPSSPPVQIEAPETTQTSPTPTPVKPPKTTPPQPDLNPPDEGDEGEGGGCSHRGDDSGDHRGDDSGDHRGDDSGDHRGDDSGDHEGDDSGDHESLQGAAHEQSDQDGGGKRFSPPGLFRRHH